MSSYYAMKTRYFVIQLIKGVTLIGISICIAAAVVIEMMQKYDEASRMAYIIGLFICAFILLGGLFLCILAFHFERVMFGRKKEEFALLQKELDDDDAVSIRDFIVTNHFVMIYTKQFSGFCNMIRMRDIIACFENPVYGTVEKINDYIEDSIQIFLWTLKIILKTMKTSMTTKILMTRTLTTRITMMTKIS